MTVMRQAAPPLERTPGAAGAGAAAGGAAAGVPAARIRPNLPVLALLALGHCVIDINQGALPALLPFLKTKFSLTYAATGTILLVANVTSSVIQPVFGHLSDRTARRWLLPWGLVFASAGLALAGLAPGYGTLLVLVVVAGLGIAAYHPEGYKTANQAAGDRKATGLSLFSIGGNIGIALGPPLVTALVAGFGSAGTLGMLAPGLVAAALIAAALPTLVPAASATARSRAVVDGERQLRGAMALLIGVVTIRSWTQLGLVAYVPFFYVDVLGRDPRVVGPLLFLFLGAGAVGTLVGGPLADRWGARRYIIWSLIAVAPLLGAFLSRGGDALATGLLAVTGFLLVSTFSVTVALAQAYLPRRLGTAAGLIVGLAIGTGGIGVALFGLVADHWGIVATLRLIAVLPLVGFGLALFLPAPRS
jgi:FSR family fosmidomycin resistance protein-like MFS transporter